MWGVDDSGKQTSGLILNDTRPPKPRHSFRLSKYELRCKFGKEKKKIVKANTLPLAILSSAPLRDIIIYILN